MASSDKCVVVALAGEQQNLNRSTRVLIHVGQRALENESDYNRPISAIEGQFLLETHNLKSHSSGWRASPLFRFRNPGREVRNAKD